MPNLTTPIPPMLSQETKTALKQLKEWGTALIDELSFILNNLDSSNVTEAAMVKAENIDVTDGKILNAQIKNLTADKITAGTIDLSQGITVKSSDDSLKITANTISISENGELRVLMGKNDNGSFVFMITDGNGNGLMLDDNGEAVFSGNINTQKDVIIGRQLKMCNYNNDGYILFGDNASISGNKNTDTLNISAMNGITLYSSGGIKLNTTNGTVSVNGDKVVTYSEMQKYVALALAAL